MNIALVIGISRYDNLPALPACEYDAQRMTKLLNSTGKYADIKLIDKATGTAELKASFREFFNKHKGVADLEEAFVYFSGHGGHTHSDALFCCTDFDDARKNATSIANSELDDLLRSVNPTVAVKVLDSCKSGSKYIKDGDDGFKKAIQHSSLGSFICMASSQRDQESFATASESEFTAAWINAALLKNTGKIYYRDIQSEIADAFENNNDQTPFFVNQGDSLECFSDVTPELIALKNTHNSQKTLPLKTDTLESTIQKVIEQEDKKYVDQELAIPAIEKALTNLINYKITDPIARKFFAMKEPTPLRLDELPAQQVIAKHAKDNNWKNKYFLVINAESYTKRVLSDPLKFLASIQKPGDSDYTTVTDKRPGSIRSTEELPVEAVRLAISSDHPSLPEFDFYLGIVHGRIEVSVLFSTVKLLDQGWSNTKIPSGDVKWTVEKHSWAELIDDPNLLWKNAVAHAEETISSFVHSLATTSGSAEEDNDDEE